jgi:hypothetical protein
MQYSQHKSVEGWFDEEESVKLTLDSIPGESVEAAGIHIVVSARLENRGSEEPVSRRETCLVVLMGTSYASTNDSYLRRFRIQGI